MENVEDVAVEQLDGDLVGRIILFLVLCGLASVAIIVKLMMS